MTPGLTLLGDHAPLLAMGIGVQEMIVIFLVLVMLSVPAIVAIVVVVFISRKANRSTPVAPEVPASKSRQDRLSELDGLLAQSLITEAEYETQRERILREV